ncbi:TPA: glycine cleavage system aminomethyltransferase GcvT [Legionella pneumophila subsp. pneumophila]|uniref:Aminomethyltransferase n=2 Tax=Legionella pneumophila TaxID=446 RepID=GCST_LEGPL|nr:glycine cleavage system aminomethyltransferase GcvT [Legionella pneumophila]Q5X0A4.1 RecName: Full=Aminomethyltransferase; AltName: Full=Glycine cleavage system T protein [Legionella pneumophila str. Lens]AOW53145.1 glycine cleavage system protein T [Legionella pneumophila subsp. pneumophila]AOW55955.1 glycine cleavage system protein T [Legionella pneumophila subsp. pneumophila]AOW58487.1 glycine cleavage system protein T [Legionella pneumophila subsp. pneumophila]AOW61327.1 glycine cleavag
MTAKTPLHTTHLACGAKMVDFHGWDMPLHYGSQLNEHHAVRNDAGMFDVSHMTIVDILGAGGRQFLRKLLTNDVDQITHNGKALYSCMCNEHGGIIDDLIVYQRASDNYRVVLNSATRQNDVAWIRAKSEGFAVGLQERRELSMLAVQGPNAIAKTLSILAPAHVDAVSTLTPFECVDVDHWFFARTGYTGEDGLEIIVPNEFVTQLWNDLLNAGVTPCGLGARDTLRLEAGMLLYGQDMDETTTPLESGLTWTVKWEPEDRGFIGMGALVSQKQQGIKRKMVGLTLLDKGIMRHGQKVIIEGCPDGIITSGSYSPTLQQSIALARVPVETGEQVLVDIRGKLIPAKVGKPRFIKQGKPV